MNSTTPSIVPSFNNTPQNDLQMGFTPHGILTIIIGGLGAVLNGLLLIAMVRNKSTIFTSNGAYLVANVAIADLLTGLNSSIWGTKAAFAIPEPVERVLFCLFWTSIEASFLTIFVMSLERYVAIVYPFKADVMLSKTRTIQSCIAVWVFSALCGAIMAGYRAIVSFCLMLIFEITIVVTTCLYYKIFIKLGQRRSCLPAQSGLQGRDRRNAELQREYQLTTVVVVLTLILIITVLPYVIAGQINVACRLFAVAQYPNLQVFVHYYFPVELMNFVLNPIVYAWRLPKYRYAFLRTLQFR